MHTIEPYYNWRDEYMSEDDVRSPFYGKEYSEFHYTNSIYDHYIHPQWDDFGSSSMVMKILFADYRRGFAIMEFLGEWNDCLHNDIMFLKRDIVDHLIKQGINKFILIGENVLNFHYSDDSYYEEWFEDVVENDGWIAMVNFPDHVVSEFSAGNVDSYIATGGNLSAVQWRTLKPIQFFKFIEKLIERRFLHN